MHLHRHMHTWQPTKPVFCIINCCCGIYVFTYQRCVSARPRFINCSVCMSSSPPLLLIVDESTCFFQTIEPNRTWNPIFSFFFYSRVITFCMQRHVEWLEHGNGENVLGSADFFLHRYVQKWIESDIPIGSWFTNFRNFELFTRKKVVFFVETKRLFAVDNFTIGY